MTRPAGPASPADAHVSHLDSLNRCVALSRARFILLLRGLTGPPEQRAGATGRGLRLAGWCALAGLVWGVGSAAAGPVHTTYLWHMHQPIYWPEQSGWNGQSYEFAYETITLGHSQSNVFSIFNSDDRVHDYQDYPKTALQSVLDLPDAGAQISFAGSLIQNVGSLGANGWNGGRYAANWYQPYRDAQAWTTSGGRRRLDPVLVGFHHPISPLLDETVFRRMIQTQKAIMPQAWGSATLSSGFFPAEMCFSERLIPVLQEEGIAWSIVPDVHIARACADYPYQANQDNCDPPNRADQINPAQGSYYSQNISRGVTTKVPAPFGLTPHRAQYINPTTGAASSIVVVPAANGMSWNEGYGLYGTGEIDAIAPLNNPARPMLILFAHDGDNAWAGGYSYFNENVTQFAHAAASRGYRPSTVQEYLADYPVPSGDIVHVEDGGWVNADGDFGSPQFINWNWPLVNAAGQFDIPNGWAEDERNWAVLTAATNRVLTAEQMSGQSPNAGRIVDPTLGGTTGVEKAWHFLLVGFESGYMYYGTALDFEVKPTLACNRAVQQIDPLLASGSDATAPTIWLPQRFPWNPGGKGGGALWGYPGGAGASMSQDFHVWTFIHDVSGVVTVTLKYRLDADGTNPQVSVQNETYAGGAEVGAWQDIPMNRRIFPSTNVYNNPDINFSVLPTYIADQYTALVTGLSDKLVDYYVEAVDGVGHVRKSPIQHVYVGTGSGGGGGPAVTWTPANPVAGQTLTVTYDPVPGTLPDNTAPVYIHIGHSGWTQVITPDPVMSFDTPNQRWSYSYSIPLTATAVDFVFNNGAGVWDNNGGADWHVPVTGSQPPPHVIDGVLDPGLTPVATCGGQNLYADFRDGFLYLAAPGVSATSGQDHFLLVARTTTTGTVPAPWAKAGTAAAWDLFLGNEDSNNFNGWFNAAGSQVTAGLSRASGAVMEGMIDVAAVWGAVPSTVRIAWGAYASPDGGVLQAQAPCGNGNGLLELGEWVTFELAASGLPDDGHVDPTDGLIRILSGNPSRGRLAAVVTAPVAGPAVVDLLDVRGRLVRRLHDGNMFGSLTVDLDLRGANPPPAGIYFLTIRTPSGRSTRRLVLAP